jgi:hypothetical protein
MNFLELKEEFENKLKDNFKFELLEIHYAPYAFGSGLTAYRITGRNVKLIYDGKENQVQFLVSSNHDKYANASWTTIFNGTPTDFIENGLDKLRNDIE